MSRKTIETGQQAWEWLMSIAGSSSSLATNKGDFYMFSNLCAMLSQLALDSEKRNITFDDLEQVRQYAKAMQKVYHGNNIMKEIEKSWNDDHVPDGPILD